MTRPLQINPDPIRIVPDEQREVWRRQPAKTRCYYSDGRGRCTSRETTGKWDPAERSVNYYCDKHAAS